MSREGLTRLARARAFTASRATQRKTRLEPRRSGRHKTRGARGAAGARSQLNYWQVRAFVSATGDGAGGAVVRNSQGEIMMAAARFYKHLPDVLTSEALAARDGVMLAQELGVEQLILELDNSTLVALLRSEDGGRCAIAGLWQEIRERRRVFHSFDISFVNREGNEVAHLCASKGSASFPLLSWSGCFPNWLMEAVSKYCNNPAIQ